MNIKTARRWRWRNERTVLLKHDGRAQACRVLRLGDALQNALDQRVKHVVLYSPHCNGLHADQVTQRPERGARGERVLRL